MTALAMKEAAEAKAKEIGMDKIVRVVAKNGKPDGYHRNYLKIWEEMKISATFGAGTNSASVRMQDGTVLYEASDYGRYLKTFRYGPWVDRLKMTAKQIEEKIDTENIIKEAEKENSLAASFEEITI
jgi:hypothetical protein